MSLNGQYDPDNIFAKIIRGEIPSARIFEDEDVLAFMDAFPQSKGHCLVVSKTSTARNMLEMDADALTKVTLATQKLGQAVVRALKPDGVRIAQFNGEASGQTIYHMHMHVIPMWEGVPLGRHGGGMADPADLKALAEKIAAEVI